MSDIVWQEKFLPGTTDNFVSNEVIVKGLKTTDVWPLLNTATEWPSYYSNASKISFNNGGPELRQGLSFRFTTFGFLMEAEVVEYVPPAPGEAARLAWHARMNGNEDTALEVVHAWLIEDLPGNRVRVLTQESQIGKPAQQMAVTKPNPMLNAHQEWLDGLVRTAIKNVGR